MWPDSVQRSFDIVPKFDHNNAYYGAWNKLLQLFFPVKSDFIIEPQGFLGDGRATVEFSVSFDIRTEQVAVLAVELNPTHKVEEPTARRGTDEQMRRRLFDLREKCPLQTVYGLSVFGTSFRIYKMEEMTITPALLTPASVSQFDIIPMEAWTGDESDINYPMGRELLVRLIMMNLKHQLVIFLKTGERYKAPMHCGQSIDHAHISMDDGLE
ncbi:hypothetical protein B0H11DRAFT_1821741 [Mycena galericulata]|nr:hypothetical protein B0H11DRAFT_1821741 [Mycena galericulata]